MVGLNWMANLLTLEFHSIDLSDQLSFSFTSLNDALACEHSKENCLDELRGYIAYTNCTRWL